jgi:hypothetical protein
MNGYQIIHEALKKIQVLPDDKGRSKGTVYYKNGHRMYRVLVDMGRLPRKGPQGDDIDVWVGDKYQDFVNQLEEIQRYGGGEHFTHIKEIHNHSIYGHFWIVVHELGDHKFCFLRKDIVWIK